MKHLHGMRELIQYARDSGATDAALIPARDILAEDHLAGFCKPPGCDQFGKAMSCPPHVAGPSAFRQWLPLFEHALVFKIDTFSEVLLSPQALLLFKKLHEIASGVQKKAVLMGFLNAKGFAGGSCKTIFCADQEKCGVIAGAPCRHPLTAKPSMSGFGINVSKLIASAGWEMKRASLSTDAAPETPVTLCGLVLID